METPQEVTKIKAQKFLKGYIGATQAAKEGGWDGCYPMFKEVGLTPGEGLNDFYWPVGELQEIPQGWYQKALQWKIPSISIIHGRGFPVEVKGAVQDLGLEVAIWVEESEFLAKFS